MPEYIDLGWAGTPAAMAAALTVLGWVPPGQDAAALDSRVSGIVVQAATDLSGAPMWGALLRVSESIPRPVGLVEMPLWMRSALVGVIADVAAPRTRTKLAIYDRMTDAELETLHALLQQVTLRQRMSWMDATVIEVDRADVRALAAAAFGADRAGEILA